MKDIACVNGSFAGRDDGVRITAKSKERFQVDVKKNVLLHIGIDKVAAVCLLLGTAEILQSLTAIKLFRLLPHKTIKV